MYLDSIEYDSTIKAGEKAVFKMKVRVEPAQESNDNRLVVGYLVPKAWKAGENTTVNYTTTLYRDEVKTMSLIPEGVIPLNGGGMTWSEALRDKYGFGPNVLDDMEWLVYWTDDVESVTVRENFNADIKIETLAGLENMRVKLGFFIGHTNDGLGDADQYKVLYTDCIEVVDGEGLVVDFCEPHFNMFYPSNATKDDIVTFKFQGGIQENALDDTDEIYLCAVAYTDTGNAYDVSGREAVSRMHKEGMDGKTFSLTCWLGDYFNIPADESVTRIEYFFSNKDGSAWVKEMDDDTEKLFITPCICQ